MLPTTAPAPSTVVRYIVRSSDVISDMRVNVFEEAAERVVWYKASERFLEDKEVVEHIVDNATSTTLWTIHRPLRGWYIRLRAPSFPPHTYISLLPIPRSSPYHAQAALTFSCRTIAPHPVRPSPSIPSATAPPPPPAPTAAPTSPPEPKSSLDSDTTLSPSPDAEFSPDDATASPPETPVNSPSHTYPPAPTPPAIRVSPPSPASVRAKLAALSGTTTDADASTTAAAAPARSLSLAQAKSKAKAKSRPQMQLTHFLLTPQQSTEPPPPDAGLLARALRAFKSTAPSAASSSFTLAPIPPAPPPAPTPAPPSVPPPLTRAPPAAPDVPAPEPAPRPPPPALLTFADTTPVFTVRSSSGVLELRADALAALGVDAAFWVALALAYADFLGDRDVSLPLLEPPLGSRLLLPPRDVGGATSPRSPTNPRSGAERAPALPACLPTLNRTTPRRTASLDVQPALAPLARRLRAIRSDPRPPTPAPPPSRDPSPVSRLPSPVSRLPKPSEARTVSSHDPPSPASASRPRLSVLETIPSGYYIRSAREREH
ncbi:hypothetical protein HETIRDRAFT_452741 [Heterobasidion irregulare TC 32-1]|uniref:Uncharacterized protein n=1 Tax=Heterobasidion irregulare (strain TC 32-1) TaxID=747525 RepID=W4K1D0_HETIT|nr:uncharacterized protein HETIRDRAFT_452741 [Heterobasidion irregulare TC 32-1]ETW79617.1 hypothetical protein HETIRDRAFT_452741 [Heterobasidion irregulare TC 32-1]